MSSRRPRAQMQNSANARLTERQKSIVLATLLTDGCPEVPNNGQAARISLELSAKSNDLLQHWQGIIGNFSV